MIETKHAAAPLITLWTPPTHPSFLPVHKTPTPPPSSPSSHSSSNPQWIHSGSPVRLPQHPLPIPTSSVSSSLIYSRAESLVWIDLQLVLWPYLQSAFRGGIRSLRGLVAPFPNNPGALRRFICIPVARVKDMIFYKLVNKTPCRIQQRQVLEKHHHSVYDILKCALSFGPSVSHVWVAEPLCRYGDLPFPDALRAGEDNCLWLLCDISIWPDEWFASTHTHTHSLTHTRLSGASCSEPKW